VVFLGWDVCPRLVPVVTTKGMNSKIQRGAKMNKIIRWFLNYTCVIVDFLVAFLGVITLGLYRPWWDFYYRASVDKWWIKYIRSKQNV